MPRFAKIACHREDHRDAGKLLRTMRLNGVSCLFGGSS